MSQLKPMIIVLLMLTSALAGCAGTDTTDLEQQIEDLQQSNDEMNETINYQSGQIGMWYELDRDNQEQLAILESMLETANNSILDLQSSILALESDLVVQQGLVLQWQQTAEDNRANLTYADLSNANLHSDDLSNANLYGVLLYGADLSYANLSNANLSYAELDYADLIYTNLTGADLTGAYLSNANLMGIIWDWAICPDGTAAYYHGQTCENNL